MSPEQVAALERLADCLEADIMPCPLGRPALLEFLRGQIEAIQRVAPPSSEVATWLIDNAYLEWVSLALEQP